MNGSSNLWLKSWLLGSLGGVLGAAAAYLTVTSVDSNFATVLLYGVSWPFALVVYGINWSLILVDGVLGGATERTVDDWLSLLRSPVVAPFAVGLSVAGQIAVLLRLPPLSLIDRIWPEPPDILTTDFSRRSSDLSDPWRSDSTLVARDDDLSELRRFAGTATGSTPRWMLLYAPHGYGKTRLAIEWLRLLSATGWDTGFLRLGVSLDKVSKARFRRKTAIVVDEASRRAANGLWVILDDLLQRKQRIRILFVDQNPVQLPRTLPTDARERIQKCFWQPSCGEGLKLMPLDPSTLAIIAPEATQETIDRAGGRPLYVLLGNNPTATIAQKIEARLSTTQDNPSEYKLLAFASLAGPVLNEVWKPLIGDTVVLSRRQEIFGGPDSAEAAEIAQVLPPLHPEPFADGMLLAWAEDVDTNDLREVLEAALSANATAVDTRLESLWSDQSRLGEDIDIVRRIQDLYDELAPERVLNLRTAAIEAFGAMVEGLKADTVENSKSDWARESARLNRIERQRPFDYEIARLSARAAFNIITVLLGERRFSKLGPWRTQLERLSERFRDNSDIGTVVAEAVANEIITYGRLQRLDDLEASTKLLDAMATAFATTRGVRLAEAVAAISATDCYGRQERYDEMKLWASRFDYISGYFKADREVRLAEAKAAANVAHYCAKSRDVADMERWAMRVQSISQCFDRQREFCLREAHVAVDAMTVYGKLKHFQDVERWAATLETIVALYPDDPDLKVDESIAFANVADDYAKCEDMMSFERFLDRLNCLAKRFPDNPELQAQYARVAVTAIFAYGRARNFEEVEHWGQRLEAVVGRFPDHRNIILAETTAAFNAVTDYGRAHRFGDLERWAKRLSVMVVRFSSDPEIRAIEARAAVNAVVYYGEVPALKRDRETWVERLRSIALSNPHHTTIQEIAAKVFGSALHKKMANRADQIIR